MSGNQSIIEKIRKLMALSERSTIEEAKAALAKVNELLTKYNLSLSEVEILHEEEYRTTPYIEFLTPSAQTWELSLALFLAEAYDCRTLTSPASRQLGVYPKIRFFGTKQNSQIVEFIFEQLRVRLQTMAYIATGEYTEAFKRTHGISPRRLSGPDHPKSWRTSWIQGAVLGIGAQLREAKKAERDQSQAQAQTSTSLLVLRDQRLLSEFRRAFPVIETTFRTINSGQNKRAADQGYQTGREMSIRGGIESVPPKQLK
jgi:hypothetical protein